MHQDVAQQIDSGDNAADLDDKHDRVLHHRARAKFDQRIDQCTTYDFGIPEGAFAGVFCHLFVCFFLFC